MEKEPETKNSDTKPMLSFTSKVTYPTCYKIIFFLLFLVTGLINNLGSILIISCSQQFAQNLNSPSLVALYPMGIIACSSLARMANSKFCIRISYQLRMFIISLYFSFGYFFMYVVLHFEHKFNNYVAFALSMVPTLVIGTGTAFGEANLLGYIRTFPGDYVSGWSCGTGFAGVSGALITLLFKIKNIKTKFLYLVVTPVGLLFFVCFKIAQVLKDKADANIPQITGENPLLIASADTTQVADATIDNKDVSNDQINEDRSKSRITIITNEKDNKDLNWKNFREGFSVGKRYIINLYLVYYLEYVLFTGLGERVSHFGFIEDEMFKDYLYEYFCLCYQIGVLISRSSLFVLKYINAVEIYTILQIVNLIFWIIEIYTKMITTWWILFILQIVVGLFGGASYVGCFYFLLESESIEGQLRELCVNIATMFNDWGILTASLSVLILDNTIMKNNPFPK